MGFLPGLERVAGDDPPSSAWLSTAPEIAPPAATPAASILRLASWVSRWVGTISAMERIGRPVCYTVVCATPGRAVSASLAASLKARSGGSTTEHERTL